MPHEQTPQNFVPGERSGNMYMSPVEMELHNQTIGLRSDFNLLTVEENVQQHAVNAAVIAEIDLPVENGSGEDKKLQLLDFSRGVPSDKGDIIIYDLPGTGPLPGMGKATTRFALRGANFMPDDHMRTFFALEPGSKTTIGREVGNLAGQQLGLSDTAHPSRHNEANATLSRKHFTIEVDEVGNITLEDHSANGTKVRGFPVEVQL